MADTRLVMGDGSSQGNASTTFQPLACGSIDVMVAGFTTETQAQVPYRTPGMLKNLFINCNGWSTTSQVLVTRQGAASKLLTVTINATGIFEDTTHIDKVAAGDKWDLQVPTGNASTRWDEVAVTYTANAGTVSRIGALSNTGGRTVTTASQSTFSCICGQYDTGGNTTEANAQFKAQVPGLLRNQWVNVTANTDTNTATVKSRKGGANGNITLTIGASGTTGIIEDTTNTDAVAINDLWNLALATGAGTVSLSIASMGYDHSTPSGDSFTNAADGGTGLINLTGSPDNFYPIGSGANDGVGEGAAVTTVRSAFICHALSVSYRTNTWTTATLQFRKNQAAGNQSAAAGASTGIFADTVNIDALLPTDQINYNTHVTGAGGGAIASYSSVYYKLAASIQSRFFTTKSFPYQLEAFTSFINIRTV